MKPHYYTLTKTVYRRLEALRKKLGYTTLAPLVRKIIRHAINTADVQHMTKDEFVRRRMSITLPEDFMRELRLAARADRRTKNQFIEIAIEEYLEEEFRNSIGII